MKTFLFTIVSFIILLINTNSYADGYPEITWGGLGSMTLTVGKHSCIIENITNHAPQWLHIISIDDHGNLCDPSDFLCHTKVLVTTYDNNVLRDQAFVNKKGDTFTNFDLFNKMIQKDIVLDDHHYSVCYDVIADNGDTPTIELYTEQEGPV